MSDHTYDAVIIGSGQGGTPLATTLTQSGWKVALVERQHVGGTCINEGCTPTKTLVASARVAYVARRAAEYGVHTGKVGVDMVSVRQRKRDIVNSWREGSRERLQSTPNLDLIFGEASFSGPKTLDVRLNEGGSLQLAAGKVFVDTGTRPRVPDLPGLESVDSLDSTSIMELENVPEHLLVLGGGYIGLEFGQMFRRFGSRVTIVQRSGQLLSREDEDVADEVAQILRQDGIQVLLDTKTLQVERAQGGDVRLSLFTPEEGECVLTGSHLLVATGRAPDTNRLNLPAAGIDTDERGFIRVNPRLETNVPGVYALGDVKGPPFFTHVSYDDFRVLRSNLLEGGDATIEGRLLPYVVFFDPQLGRVGLTETKARAQGYDVRVAKMPMSSVARALEVGEARGKMKAVVDAHTGCILGAAVLGFQGGELMGVLQMAMLGGVTYTQIRDAMFAHPTLTESLNNLFAGLDD